MDPLTIYGANLLGWWRIDSLRPNPPSGQILLWEDESGNGADLETVHTGTYPKFETNIVIDWPAVRFLPTLAIGGHTWMRYPSGFFTGVTEAEIFIVVRAFADPGVAGPGGTLRCALWRLCTEGLAETSLYPHTDGSIYEGAGSTVRKTVGDPTPDLEAKRIYNITTKSGGYTVRLDGTQIFTTGTNTVAWPAFGDALLGGGVRSGIFEDEFDGWVLDHFIIDREATSGERSDTLDYLARYDSPAPPVVPTAPSPLRVFLSPEVGARLSGTVEVV